MSKELKAPDKVTQKMTRDGAIAENLTTGETTSISERPPEENYSAPAAGAAEKATQRIGTEVSRHLEKGAEKKTLDAAQLKTHTSRLQFSEAERATPELQKSIRKSEKAADRLDAARAAIPKQTKIKKERVFDEAKGKAKTRLSFEKTDKPPNCLLYTSFYARRKGGAAGMYFTKGKQRAFELLMQQHFGKSQMGHDKAIQARHSQRQVLDIRI